MLNARGIKTDFERAWTGSTVHQVLTNEKYIGNNVFNRVSFKLKKKRVRNPQDMWIRANGVFEAIVDPAVFIRAQEKIKNRSQKKSDAELINMLKALYEKKGWLSKIIIDECEDIPSSGIYQRRFGTLVRAYKLAGFMPDIDFSYVEVNRRVREMHPKVVADVIGEIENHGGTIDYDEETGLIKINDEFTALLVIARCRFSKDRPGYRWVIKLSPILTPDITIAVRLDSSNHAPLDYYLLPSIDMTTQKLRLAEDNAVYLDAYRFDNLDFLYGMAEQTRIGDVI